MKKSYLLFFAVLMHHYIAFASRSVWEAMQEKIEIEEEKKAKRIKDVQDYIAQIAAKDLEKSQRLETKDESKTLISKEAEIPKKEDKTVGRIKKQQKKMRLLNVMLFNDTTEKQSNLAAVTTFFAIAICQKAVPLLATSHVVYNLLDSEQKSEYVKQINEVLNKISWKDWHIYEDIQFNPPQFYLFIPEEYKKKIDTEFNNPEYQDEISQFSMNLYKKYNNTFEDILTGFKIDPKFGLFKKVSIDEIRSASKLKLLKNQGLGLLTILNYELLRTISSIKSIFFNKYEDPFGLWNIILYGHGTYPADLIPNLKLYNIIKENLSEDVLIAGFKLNSFRNFIQWLINFLNVNLLYYLTCFGSDLNLILPYLTTLIKENRIGREYGTVITNTFTETLVGSKKPNFNIVTGALTSTYVYNNLINSLTKCDDRKSDLGYINFVKFFEYLNEYSKTDTTQPTIFNKTELQKIFREITSSLFFKGGRYEFSALPSIMYPRTDKFTVIPLYDNIGVITTVEAIKHKIENTPLKLNNTNLLLIYPEEVPIKVEINNKLKKDQKLSIVSMQPGLALHKINNIQIKFSGGFPTKGAPRLICLKLLQLFNLIIPKSPKYFYIEKITIEDDSGTYEFNDLILLTVDKEKITDSESGQVDFIFTSPDKNVYRYKFSRKITPIFEKLKNLEQLIPDDNFLNALFNYFYLNATSLKYDFDFNNILLLLSNEDKETLKKTIESLTKEEKLEKPKETELAKV